MTHHPASLLRGLLVALSVGAFVGAISLLVDFSLKHLIAGAVAGAVFTGVLFAALPVLSGKRWGLASASAVAGMIAGAAWWRVAKPSVSIWVSVGIGLIFAALMVFSEWSADRRESKRERKPGRESQPGC